MPSISDDDRQQASLSLTTKVSIKERLNRSGAFNSFRRILPGSLASTRRRGRFGKGRTLIYLFSTRKSSICSSSRPSTPELITRFMKEEDAKGSLFWSCKGEKYWSRMEKPEPDPETGSL